jgi:hypothetical protein
MADPLQDELAIIAALRLAAPPPDVWIDAAAQIPTTLGDLAGIEGLVDSPEFRARFADDPAQALDTAGLPVAPRLIAAVRDRLGPAR